jgi:hypothetical protein
MTVNNRRKRRGEDNIKMSIKEIRCEGMDWINLTEGRDQLGFYEYYNEYSNSINCC